jgi:TPR repeat protein
MLVIESHYSRDAVQGASWFQVAAERGNYTASTMLGLCHWKGYGVPKSWLRAHELLSSYSSRRHINDLLLRCSSLLPYSKEYSEFAHFYLEACTEPEGKMCLQSLLDQKRYSVEELIE